MVDIEVLKDKALAFAIRIVLIYKQLCDGKKDFPLARQVLQSGTSIGESLEEAIGAHSDKDFSGRLRCAYKESRKTMYWLRLLLVGDFITQEQAYDFLEDVEEINTLLTTAQAATSKHFY